MRKLALLSTLFVVAVSATSFVTPASAQATRTWVSGVGDDVNPCSRTAPCKTFAGAISKTAAKGAINVLDPGGFGAVTITKSITIRAEYVEAGVLVSGTNGITVNTAATDTVVLEGLDIEGLTTSPNGVHIIGGGSVVIRRCSIHQFSGNAVNLVGAVNAKVLVQDSVIANNGGGVNVQGAAGVANTAVIDRTTFDTHANFAIQVAQGGAAFISLTNLIGSGPKVVLSGTGAISTYGNNVIRGASAALPPALPLQ
jgi:hypothetical protein